MGQEYPAGGPYSQSMRTIDSPGELYAHAIALEREAAERYGEFARRMDDLGNAAVAEEGEHVRLVERLLEHTPQPGLDAQMIFGR